MNVFQSDNPEEPTLEDEFRMDLTASLGHKSVVDMLSHIDAWEYSFWFEKYKRNCFGPSVTNNMLAQVCYLLANQWSKSQMPFTDFVMKVSQGPSEQDILNTTCSWYHSSIVRWLQSKPKEEDLRKQPYNEEQIKRILKGFKHNKEDYKELEKLAKIVSDKYRQGLEERAKENNA